MSHLRPKDDELRRARERNARRLHLAERPLRSLSLRPFEVAALDLAGEVVIERPIWPPRLLRVPWCQWVSQGERVRLLEDVKAFGVDPQHAVYAYRNDPRFEELDWAYFPASKAPLASSRFPMFCVSVERIEDRCRWRIHLKKAREAMR